MEYIDLQKSYMYAWAKVMKTNGDSLSDSDKVGVVNLFLPSLFEQCTVSLQGKMITSSLPIQSNDTNSFEVWKRSQQFSIINAVVGERHSRHT